MCLFKFERPQRLKVVVHSRNKFGGRSMPEDSQLGAHAHLWRQPCGHVHACVRMHSCRSKGTAVSLNIVIQTACPEWQQCWFGSSRVEHDAGERRSGHALLHLGASAKTWAGLTWQRA